MKIRWFASAAIGLLAGWAGLAQGAVLLNDSFSDGERSTQDLPTSAQWYSARATADANVTGGALRFSNFSNNRAGALAYLTSSGSYVDMVVGDTLALSFSYRYGANVDSEGGLYFGFYNSGGTRVSADNHDFNSPTFANDVGYVGAGIFDEDPSSRYRIRDRTNGVNNMASVTPMPALNSTAQTGASEVDTWYQASLSLSLLAPNQMRITSVLDGQTLVATDNVWVASSFDQILIMVGQKPIGYLDIDNVLVTHTNMIPEPASVGLILLGAIALRMTRRRR